MALSPQLKSSHGPYWDARDEFEAAAAFSMPKDPVPFGGHGCAACITKNALTSRQRHVEIEDVAEDVYQLDPPSSVWPRKEAIATFGRQSVSLPKIGADIERETRKQLQLADNILGLKDHIHPDSSVDSELNKWKLTQTAEVRKQGQQYPQSRTPSQALESDIGIERRSDTPGLRNIYTAAKASEGDPLLNSLLPVPVTQHRKHLDQEYGVLQDSFDNVCKEIQEANAEMERVQARIERLEDWKENLKDWGAEEQKIRRKLEKQS
ncbi:hypothetical protein BKA64DRAFT_766303 [Cadophora sp. MPI-SDFR-AT-0126]|nr:hypothetical protein BKA64DRAFT_766303 [Leotiomycetes sp. MPI-SDFR-AT-0126]